MLLGKFRQKRSQGRDLSENSDGGDRVVVAVPIELLFTEDLDRVGKSVFSETAAWRRHNQVWANLAFGRLSPHIELMRAFRGDAASSVSSLQYLKWYDNLWKLRDLNPEIGDVLTARYDHFRHMSVLMREHGPQHTYFTVDLKYVADESKFFILDGHHRLAFLYTMGCRKVLASMTREDFAEWSNHSARDAVMQLVAQQNRELFYTPILHPAFYEVRVERDFGYRSRLDILLNLLGPQRAMGRMVDIGSNLGYFTHQFSREGIDIVGVEPYRDHFDLSVALSDLYRLKPSFLNKSFELIDRNEVFDGALLLTVFYHVLSRGEHEPFLKALDGSVRSYVIWESGHDPEGEKAIITSRTHFRRYRRLATTFGTGRAREFGVFISDYVGDQTSVGAALLSAPLPEN